MRLICGGRFVHGVLWLIPVGVRGGIKLSRGYVSWLRQGVTTPIGKK